MRKKRKRKSPAGRIYNGLWAIAAFLLIAVLASVFHGHVKEAADHEALTVIGEKKESVEKKLRDWIKRESLDSIQILDIIDIKEIDDYGRYVDPEHKKAEDEIAVYEDLIRISREDDRRRKWELNRLDNNIDGTRGDKLNPSEREEARLRRFWLEKMQGKQVDSKIAGDLGMCLMLAREKEQSLRSGKGVKMSVRALVGKDSARIELVTPADVLRPTITDAVMVPTLKEE